MSPPGRRAPDESDLPRLATDLLATDRELKKFRVHPGDTVAFLGYPHRVEANEAGFPVLRSGAIASFPLIPGTERQKRASCERFESAAWKR
jgi:hypothetical protein